MVAGYVDKIVLEPWTAADWALFPNAVKVEIVKKASSNFGHVLDVEPGDATPAQAPGWAKMRRAAGLATPTIYCNASTWPSVQQAFRDQGVAQPLYWIARYDDEKNFPTLNGITAIAKQYHGNDPANFDLSYVADYWPGVDGEDMAITDEDVNKIWNGLVPNKTNGRNDPARELLGWTNWEAKRGADAVASLANVVVSLKDLIIADDANDVTAEALAEALKPIIATNVVPAVVDAVNAATENLDVEVNAQDIANQVATVLSSRLAS